MGSVTFLGTGASLGVPVISCECDVCLSTNIKNKRSRSSILIDDNENSILVDTSTDLRMQALRENLKVVTAVLYTHHHSDHLHGIDELRVYSFRKKNTIPIYANKTTIENITTMFPYIFSKKLVIEGGAPPRLSPIEISTDPFNIGSTQIIPIPIEHGSMTILGYRVNDFAYVTDCSFIPEKSIKLLKNLKVLVLGAIGLKKHNTHFTVEKAIEQMNLIRPERGYITHLDHSVDHDRLNRETPDFVSAAWDGLKIDI